jgi:putative transposase
MLWARMVAYVTGTVNQELLLRNEYLGAENRILRGQIKGRLLLSEGEKATLAEIAQRLGRKALEELAAVAKPDTLLSLSMANCYFAKHMACNIVTSLSLCY